MRPHLVKCLPGLLAGALLWSACSSSNPDYCPDPDVCDPAKDLETPFDLSEDSNPADADKDGDVTDASTDLPVEKPLDLSKKGPLLTVSFDLKVTANRATIELTAIGPSTDGKEITKTLGAMPWVVLSPGFSTDRKQYQHYGERLASYGVVTFLQKSPNEWNHGRYREDTGALLAYLLAPTGPEAARLSGRLDGNRIGLVGHSLGGKISFLVAQGEPRVKAVLGIDPVDQRDPTARKEMSKIKLPPGVPIGFLGEVVSKAGSPPCAPAADNYEVLYTASPAPAFAVTFANAAHMDFVDDPGSCFSCGFCKGGTAPKERTNALAVKYTTAYFLSTIGREKRAVDTLFGAQFQADVAAGYVSRVTK